MVPLRVAVIVLIFANLLALALWKGWLGGGDSDGQPERLSNQLNAERLKLAVDARPPAPRPREAIAEAPRTSPEPPVPTPAPAPAQRESAPATDTSAPPACVAFAGLGVDQAQELAARIGKVGGGLKLNESRSEQPSSWWVYIPSPGSKDGADRKAAEVRKLGVDDLYIVPDAGPNQFAISLGLFKSEVAANRQLEVLRAKGVRSAQIATRGSALVRLEVRGPSDSLATLVSDLSDHVKGVSRQGCKP
ncbi:MAG TPA: SPOR domain-containing protein [Zoogloea sp.]|uniref:SPOR domain-containing protein n=1 Tax=Zoogloea sp. TaxID=49181 RepID=UPI002BEE6DEF|nr:SPOR domain-containing protein [Zoogloea sp.]HMW52934.1 SPOR domain-containing protein [Rhodocyclaceae bacterium]HNA68859.1 SPOR domain-containing protein [Rhodocyclaceae bacterium]HNC78647.1 SPOR domain-containing protein [Rhodocyclaceae bacterium]HNF60604.1 SPOR domain-containing protein [Rhodocyclaceae bacterium]HNI46812.1 SPOR domain-containing protein [Zoogloea sp.]